ncbi:MAG: methionyl-tRNA formyltransferase [Pantoea sp. Brub]|nr:methionyl-tRNA formyltransferase [Pantoea sp. Brub]
MCQPLKIIFAGTSNFAVEHFNILLNSKHKIVGVLTKFKKPSSNKRKIIPNQIKNIAEKNNIQIFQPDLFFFNIKETEKLIDSYKIDLIIVVSYGIIFPKNIINLPKLGCINIHASLLPKWRGPAPIQRSLLAGDTKTGITIIQMDDRIDTGDILYQKSCNISVSETSNTLCDKLAKLGAEGLLKTLSKIISNEIYPKKQKQLLNNNYANKIKKEEARINWGIPAIDLERRIRAFNPWPISFFKINNEWIKVWQANVVKHIDKTPGTIIQVNKQGIQIATIDGILNLVYLQPSGRRIMSAQDLLNSRKEWFQVGAILK